MDEKERNDIELASHLLESAKNALEPSRFFDPHKASFQDKVEEILIDVLKNNDIVYTQKVLDEFRIEFEKKILKNFI